MDGIVSTQASSTLQTQNDSTLSPGSTWDSAITITSSPSSTSSCDGIDNDECDSFGDSGDIPSKSTNDKLDIDLGLSTSSTMQLVAELEDPESAPVPIPPDADRLHALFSEYETLVNRQGVPHERKGSLVKNDDSPRSHHPESDQQVIPHPLVSVAREQKRGISKRKTQRQKNGARRDSSRTKRALASTIQEYEYMQLGETRRAPNESIEVEVFWAPILLPCDQLRGQQAIEEAKDLVIRRFGHAAWETEWAKFGSVAKKKRTLG
ncbi:hypothetical protein H634G_11016 [Metarhizium anisopliae BRIP 53293]|uniref:Uncharacterized protein n=1 Tax=Metarhizium anisopliae BRIP 53293 TaxID=1291518 RepID=A0A0D9NII8_METAN|nr:hypothetical protein H634G_11016 [Metarhizium anisopliae BRIP 53293]